MPELPEVQALVDFLAERTDGLAVTGGRARRRSACSRPSTRRRRRSRARRSTASRRHGKFLDLDVDGMHLVFHLARAGWLRWSRRSCRTTVAAAGQVPDRAAGAPGRRRRASTSPRPARKKSLAAYVVRDPAEVPGIAAARPRPAGRRLHARARSPAMLDGAPHADQGRCCATRRSSPASATPTPTRSCTSPSFAVRHRRQARRRGASTGSTPRCATRWPSAVGRGVGQAGQGAQGREARRHARARPHRPALPGLRRHRARGVVRRLVAAVLPDLPDRRQAARRPPDVASCSSSPARREGAPGDPARPPCLRGFRRGQSS